MMGNAEQRLDPGERCVQMPSTSEWVFFGCFFFLCRANAVGSCVCTRTCVFARVYACSGLSELPVSSVHHRARRQRERDQKRVSHPADERVKVKAAPSQKKTSHGFFAHFFFFEVIQEEGGKRHTFPIALKHGVRQLPSCCTL